MKQGQNNLPAVLVESGFTLLELLASMTLLLIMVGFLAVAFNAASTAWRQGEHDADRAQAARTTVDLIARDLSQAIVSSSLPLYGNTNCLAFVAPVNDDGDAADLAEVTYVLNWNDSSIPPAQQNIPPYKLIRRFTTPTTAKWDAYSNPGNWPSTYEFSNTVCDTVLEFTLTYYDAKNHQTIYWNSTLAAPGWTENGAPVVPLAGTPAMTNTPPAYINIHLGVVDSRTAALLGKVSNPSIAYDNLTNRAVRYFDAYVKVPQR